MSEWKEYKLGEISTTIISGGTPKSSVPEYYSGEIPWLNTKEVNFNRIRRTERCISELGLENSSAKWIPAGAVIVAMYGATAGKVAFSKIDLTTNQACCNLIINKNKADAEFVYYALMSEYDKLSNLACGAAQQNLSVGVISEFPILLPPIEEQRRIAGLLGALDEKIDLLNHENATLEALNETLFRHHFIENPDPTWTEGKLENVVEVLDYRRKPLSKMERDKMKNGNILYPYYGAAEIMDYIDDYLFDGEYILLGEDGTVRTDDGHPILQLATGKFWPNNHAHVLKAKEPFNNCFLWYYFKTSNIDEIVTGAVQPKINQANLMSLPIYEYPTELIKRFQNVANPLWNKIKSNRQQIQNLAALRDILLPRLMSGEVKVPGQ